MKKTLLTSLLSIIFNFVYSQTVDPGMTPGQLDISLTGGATYAVPISMPPGIKDVIPQIGLAYNSQAGSGQAGWGWNITGLSSISRIPETTFHDGEIDGVDFDNKDRFALDGQRLILQSGVYGGNGSIYVTENYSNIKVKAVGVHSRGATFGPNYFEVYYPNGNIAVYGNTGNATANTSWNISQWKDPQGVTINYSYIVNTEPRLISNIKYGSGGNSTAGINSIIFNWETRSRPEYLFSGGEKIIFDKRLKNIQVNNLSTLLRQYNLTYNSSSDAGYSNLNNYDRLKSIQEANGLGNLLSPIKFEYDSTTSNFQETQTNGFNFDDDKFDKLNIVQGDFNLDGHQDLAVYETYTSNIRIHTNQNYTGEGININTFPLNKDNVFATNLLVNNQLTAKQSITVSKVEVNNLILNHYTLNGETVQLQGTNTFNLPTYTTDECDGLTNVVHPIPFIFQDGDFNGDGITDLLAFEQNHEVNQNCYNVIESDPYDPYYTFDICNCESYNTINDKKVYLVNIKDNTITQIGTTSQPILKTSTNSDKQFISLGEFNGDGKADIFYFTEGKVSVYGLNANNQLELLHETANADIYKKITASNSVDKHFPVVIGDYNGDGLTDFMCPNTAEITNVTTNSYGPNGEIVSTINYQYYYSWRVFSANGKTITQGKYLNTLGENGVYYYNHKYGNSGFYSIRISATDIDADGKSDLIWHKTEKESTGNDDYEKITIHRNNSNGLISSESSIAFTTEKVYGKSYEDSTISAQGFPIFIDSNHANYSSEYAYIAVHRMYHAEDKINIKRYFSASNIRANFLLKKITNNSVETSIVYGALTSSNTNYSSQTNEVYPNVNVNFSPFTYVATKITETGAGISRSQDFKYKGFVSNVQGLGFFGPQEHKRSSWYGNGVSKIWSISLHDISKRGAVSFQYTALSDVDYLTNYISKTANTYLTTLGANKVFTNLPTLVTQVDALQGVTTSNNFTYDAFNNVIMSKTTFQGGFKKVDMQYSNQTATLNNTYHVGKLTQKIETNTLGSDTFVTTEQYSYNNNLLTQKKNKANNSNWITESFVNDTFGNVTKKILSATGIANRAESFTYDTSGIFLIRSTDIEGLATSYYYNSTYGYLASETNPYGQSTYYSYDGWGRMTKSLNFLYNETKYLVETLPNGGIRKTVDYPNGPDTVTEFNAFGWETSSKTLSLNNQWVKSVINYDILGRKIAVSDPVFDYEQPSLWTNSNYDVYGRIINIFQPNGKVTSTQYNGLSITVNDGVKTVTSTKDAAGNVITMTDPGGTVNYTYFANGAMKTANYDGHIVSTQLDVWGRKSSLTDPDAGTYTYQYNDIGEILLETTPKGSTSYNYDVYGKILNKNVVGDAVNINTNYTYDATTKLLNQITGSNSVDGNNKTQNLVYDSYKRIKEVYESSTSEGTNYNKKIEYDNLGRINTTEYNTTYQGQSSQVKTQNIYDNSGNIIQIKDVATNAILWQKYNENARGQTLSIILGNQVIKAKTYDAYGYLKTIKDYKIESTGRLSRTIDPGEIGDGPIDPIDPPIDPIDPVDPVDPVEPEHDYILDILYSFNTERGLLDKRTNKDITWTTPQGLEAPFVENFSYDAQERLTQITGAVNFTQNYDNKGRITQNSAIGTYNYEGNNYQLSNIDLNPAGDTYYQNHSLQEAEFNAFKKPVTITETGNGKIYFEYDPITMERTATYFGANTEAEKNATQYKKYFSSIIPVEITKNNSTGELKIITFVGGDAYSAPMMHIKRTGTAPLNTFFYLHRDYLGSVLAISDSQGNVVERRQFGAWGVVDKFWNSNGDTDFNFNTTLLDRGYTGHEHLFFVSLINMNGRLYDAKLGRFLSPDNFVQDPYNTQSFNRYGYVVNNPLMFTDESGEFIHIIIGAVVGGLINLAVKAIQGDINSFGDGLAAFGIGAVAGAVGAATGGAAFLAAGGGAAGAGGFIAGAISGAVGSAFASPLQSLGNHLYFGDPMMTLKDWGISVGFGGILGGAVNGTIGSIKGKSFWTGNAKVTPIVAQTSGVQPMGVQKPDASQIANTTTNIENTISNNNAINVLESKYFVKNSLDGSPSFQRQPFTPKDVINAVKGDNYNLLGNRGTHADIKMSQIDYSLMMEDFKIFEIMSNNPGITEKVYNFGVLGTGAIRAYPSCANCFRFYWSSQNVNYKFIFHIY